MPVASVCSEYHVRVRHLIHFALAGVIAVAFHAMADAQITTGTGQISGSHFSPAPPTGTVIPHIGAVIPRTGAVVPPTNPNGFGATAFPRTHVPLSPSAASAGDRSAHHRHHNTRAFDIPYFVYPELVPYYSGQSDAASDEDDSEYQGGPTIFDRRGSGASSYIQPLDVMPKVHGSEEVAASALEPASPSTVLVFKDGHQLEIGNYAIVGPTLFDLTPGHARKIALADLNLDATEKQNEDQGVVFQLPPSGS